MVLGAETAFEKLKRRPRMAAIAETSIEVLEGEGDAVPDVEMALGAETAYEPLPPPPPKEKDVPKGS